MFRMRRNPVMRATATTAVVVETASAVSHSQEEKAAAQQAAAAPEPVAPAPEPVAAAPTPAAAPTGGSDLTSQLEQLSQLHNAGVLSDQEFAEAKQKVLTGG